MDSTKRCTLKAWLRARKNLYILWDCVGHDKVCAAASVSSSSDDRVYISGPHDDDYEDALLMPGVIICMDIYSVGGGDFLDFRGASGFRKRRPSSTFPSLPGAKN